ncbi:MAG: hypothetical protein IKN96_06705 [Oscillibacter sp.]|nr:hypothetical protein [Oscillibacter sp.]
MRRTAYLSLTNVLDDITSVCDLQVEQKDIYAAIIMDALETSVSFDYWMENMKAH